MNRREALGAMLAVAAVPAVLRGGANPLVVQERPEREIVSALVRLDGSKVAATTKWNDGSECKFVTLNPFDEICRKLEAQHPELRDSFSVSFGDVHGNVTYTMRSYTNPKFQEPAVVCHYAPGDSMSGAYFFTYEPT